MARLKSTREIRVVKEYIEKTYLADDDIRDAAPNPSPSPGQQNRLALRMGRWVFELASDRPWLIVLFVVLGALVAMILVA